MSFILCILVAAFLYFGIPWAYLCWLRGQLKRKAIRDKALVLTFDDGPGSTATPAVLRILDENDVKATFFLLGCNVTMRGEIVRQINRAGHEIGFHGYGHSHYWKISPFQALSDIRQGQQTIDTALRTEGQAYAFRPPYGKINLVCLLYLLLRRVPIVSWTVDAGDRGSQKLPDAQKLASQVRLAGGAVVLAHDSDRVNPDITAFTLKSVRAVLSMAKETGMEIMTVSELLNRKK